MPLNRADIKVKMLNKLKGSFEDPTSSLQVSYFIDLIREYIHENNSTPHEQSNYHQWVMEILHEWYRSGLIYFGKPDGYQGYPFITITDFGITCINNNQTISYDPDGYIKNLQTLIPQIDQLTLAYISESIATYNLNQLLSSTITLGAASENIILMLIETYASALQNSQARVSFNRSVSRVGIYKKFDLLKVSLDSHKHQIPHQIWQDLLPELEAIFNFIRINRNSAGHPSGQATDKNNLTANFQIFTSYSKKLFDLIDYLQNNQLT